MFPLFQRERTQFMSVAKKKRHSIADVLRVAETIVKKRSLSWYDKLNKDDQQWCENLKKEYNNGKYGHIPMGSLAQAVRDELGIRITNNTFRVWLKDRILSK